MSNQAKQFMVPDLEVPISRLKPYGRNPRRGDVEAIRRSLEVNGQYRPIVVNKRTDEVLAGNHTLMAAKELGWKQIAVTFVDVDEEQAKRIVLVDNRANDLAGYEAEALVELLEELDELTGTGYEQDDLDDLLDELERDREALGEDDPPPPPAKPKTKPGDRYLLGNHRLLCGDARHPDAYKRLLGAERADVLWTDPPYGVSYEGKTAEGLRIECDSSDELRGMLGASFEAIDGALKRGARVAPLGP